MFNRKIIIVFLIFTLVLSYACTYNKAEVKPVVDCSKIIPDTVSFSADIVPVLNKSCNTSGCHSGGSPQGNLNLEATKAYAQLNKSGSGYLNVNNPHNSVLYLSLTSTSDPMPPVGTLDPCTVELIVKWMSQGAKNN